MADHWLHRPLAYDDPARRREREIAALEARIRKTSSDRKRAAWQAELDALRGQAGEAAPE